MAKYKFEIKPEHLKLMQKFCIGWNDAEFGSPEVDPRRPYGNSDPYQDMIEILGFKKIKECIFEFTLGKDKWILKGEDKYNIYLDGKDEEKLKKKLLKLHEETEQALQICLNLLKFETGVFERDDFANDWRNVDDK